MPSSASTKFQWQFPSFLSLTRSQSWKIIVSKKRSGVMRGFKCSVIVILISLLIGSSKGEWVSLGGERGAPPDIRVVQHAEDNITVEIKINGFFESSVEVEGKEFLKITLPETTPIMKKGYPELPKVARSLIIPDRKHMNFRVLEIEFVERKTIPIVPSKGHFTRDINPDEVPYVFSPFYERDEWFPQENFLLGEPYILRDFRGIRFQFNPFQYNPAEGILKIAKRIKVQIYADGEGRSNIKQRRRPLTSLQEDFLKVYRNHFLNFGFYEERYNPIPEVGRLLIVAYTPFRDSVLPLFEWKKQKGIPSKLALYPDSTGSGADAIKSYIQNEYNSPDGLTYIILVGDVEQVPTLYGSYEGAPSDPCYVKLEGNDHYPDAFISRISATSSSQVGYQVWKFVNYEMNPDTGSLSDWYHKGTGIASNEGDPPDWQRAEWLRDSLLNYTYTHVDQIYDPGATVNDVFTALNDGRSILNYIGHGSGTSWGTTGFSSYHVYQLSNGEMLPFIIDVACLNGNFTMDECFAEAWLRAGSVSSPKGAIGMYASSTLASWVPPCVMQMEAIHLLVSEQKNTFGGLCFNGVMKAMDQYQGTGEDVKLMEQYNLFGDCSAVIRTDSPDFMSVVYDPVIVIGSTTYDVDVLGVEGALVALYANGVLYGYAYTDQTGHASVELMEELTEPGEMTLTVTAYNKVPFITTIQVILPQGPYVQYYSHSIDDIQTGNDNSEINPGETVRMKVEVVNIGVDTAYGVQAKLSTDDSNVMVVDSLVSFGDIGAGDTVVSLDYFEFSVSSGVGDGYLISFTLDIWDSLGNSWTSYFSEVVRAPFLVYVSYYVVDQDGDGVVEPGEECELYLTFRNDGGGLARDIVGTLYSLSGYIDVLEGEEVIPDVPSGATVTSYPFLLYVTPSCPSPSLNSMEVDLGVEGVYSFVDTFDFLVGQAGFVDSLETGAPGWTHSSITPGYGDEWHLSTERYHSSLHSFKCGVPGGQYSNYLDAGLVTPEFFLEPGSELTFWQWVDAETSSYYLGYAYDGGIVEIKVGDGSWEEIYPVDGYPFKIRGGSENPLPAETPCYSGRRDWERKRFDLAGYSGVVQLRFRFATDRAVQREGWYIDDVVVMKRVGADVTVEPPLFEFMMFSGSDTVETLVLGNVGDDTLSYSIDLDYLDGEGWMSVYPLGGVIVPGSSVNVLVDVMTAGLEEGVYEGFINISTDDPDEPLVSVPVELTVYMCSPGDVNGDGYVNTADLLYLENYFYFNGPPPNLCGDVNGDSSVDIEDMVALAQIVLRGESSAKSSFGKREEK